MALQLPTLGARRQYPVTDADWMAWASSVLRAIGADPTNGNAISALYEWTKFEKPPGQLTQWNNPLNTTLRYGDSSPVNDAGVQDFSTLSDGINATVQTLQNPPAGTGAVVGYPAIISELRQGTPFQSWSQDAVTGIRTWGTSGFANEISTINAPPPSVSGSSASGDPCQSSNPLDRIACSFSSVGSAITAGTKTLSDDIVKAETTAVQQAIGAVAVVAGLVMMTVGVLVLVWQAQSVRDVVKRTGRLAAAATPQGRAIGAARSVRAARRAPSSSAAKAPAPTPTKVYSGGREVDTANVSDAVKRRNPGVFGGAAA